MRHLLPNGQYVGEDQSFTLNDVQYPSNWFYLATEEDKAAIGAVPVIAINERADDQFYIVSEKVVGAEIEYINTPRNLDELKVEFIKKINATAYSILQPTDYIDTRNMRDPSYKPEWMTWRESVLTASRAAVAEIESCTTVEQLAALPQIAWPRNPDALVGENV